MPLSVEYRTYLADLFSCIGPIRIRRAFGLDGLVADEVMFGLVVDERIYLRTDENSRRAYEREGGRPFTFRKHTGERIVTSYVAIPERLYDEPDELKIWARRALAAALESPAARKKRARRVRMDMRTPSDPKRRPAAR